MKNAETERFSFRARPEQRIMARLDKYAAMLGLNRNLLACLLLQQELDHLDQMEHSDPGSVKLKLSASRQGR